MNRLITNQNVAMALPRGDCKKIISKSGRISKEISEGFEKVFNKFNNERQKRNKNDITDENFLLSVPLDAHKEINNELLEGLESCCILNVEKSNTRIVNVNENLYFDMSHYAEGMVEKGQNQFANQVDDINEYELVGFKDKNSFIQKFMEGLQGSVEDSSIRILTDENTICNIEIETVMNKGENVIKLVTGNEQMADLIRKNTEEIEKSLSRKVIVVELKGEKSNEINSINFTKNNHVESIQVNSGEINKNYEEGFCNKLIDAIIKEIKLLNKDNAREIQVQSKNDTISRISLKITPQEDGDIVEITTDNESTKDLLEKNILHIRDVLGKSEIVVKETEKSTDTKSEIKSANQGTYSSISMRDSIISSFEKGNTNDARDNAKFGETDVIRLADVNETDKQSMDFQNLLKNEQADMSKDEMFKEIFPKEKYVSSIIKEFSVLIGEKKNKVELQLKPDFLGKIILKVSSENGNTVAKIITESVFAKDLLNSNFNELKETLREQGVVIEELETLPGREQQSQGQSQSDNWNGSGERTPSYTKTGYDFSFVEDDKGESLTYARSYEAGVEYYA